MPSDNNESEGGDGERKTVGQSFILNDGCDTAAEGAIQRKKTRLSLFEYQREFVV